MINKILETLYSKVFINIIVGDSKTTVYAQVHSKNKVLDSNTEEFKTISTSPKMLTFINSYTSQSPYHYISILDKSLNQGAVPSCKEIKKFIKDADLKTICISNEWSLYTHEEDIKTLRYEYKEIGLDFIFSPFKILTSFFKDKIDSTLAIFLLVQDVSMSLCIFDNSKMLYAQYLDMSTFEEEEDLIMDSILDEDDDDILEMQDVNLDDLDADMDSLEDFADIEDLDSGLDIDEFSEAQEIEDIVEDKALDIENINDDYKRFIAIQDSISRFYKDDKYESEFLEHIYIADSADVSNDLKKYLKEEMFLNVVIRRIGLEEELCDMAKAELK